MDQLLPHDVRYIKGFKVAFSETVQAIGASTINIFHKKIICMFNVSTLKFVINDNALLDVISIGEQQFSSKKQVHYARV